MSGKQVAGDGMPSSLAGMSKSQLYEIMSQMKALIEQNKQQARQILIQNPALTRALFQAQVMLGMVQSPQASTSVSSAPSQIPNPQPQPQPMSSQPPNIQLLKPSPIPNQPASSFPGQTQMRKQQQQPNQIPNQATMVSNPHSHPIPPNTQPQPNISRGSLQPLQQPNAQLAQISTPQSSQVPNATQLQQHSISQPPSSLHQSSMPTQSLQPMQNSGNQYMPLQPPLPQQLRPQMSGFPHQGHGQMGPNMGFQHPGGPQVHHSQHMFQSGAKHSGGMGPSFQQGQAPQQNQHMPPSLYQGGNPRMGMGMDFNQTGNSRQSDRGGPNWAPSLQENTPGQLTGQPSFSGQLAPELEKQLLQQVMSLTPEQINQLPPEQRNQILQLQQMLRQ